MVRGNIFHLTISCKIYQSFHFRIFLCLRHWFVWLLSSKMNLPFSDLSSRQLSGSFRVLSLMFVRRLIMMMTVIQWLWNCVMKPISVLCRGWSNCSKACAQGRFASCCQGHRCNYGMLTQQSFQKHCQNLYSWCSLGIKQKIIFSQVANWHALLVLGSG